MEEGKKKMLEQEKKNRVYGLGNFELQKLIIDVRIQEVESYPCFVI